MEGYGGAGARERRLGGCRRPRVVTSSVTMKSSPCSSSMTDCVEIASLSDAQAVALTPSLHLPASLHLPPPITPLRWQFLGPQNLACFALLSSAACFETKSQLSHVTDSHNSQNLLVQLNIELLAGSLR